ncbi:MAG: hypothetical protein M3Y54_05525 [Bacteroidota bacterium]|nr:hypothetical protein [Bacteroidota bacterium]
MTVFKTRPRAVLLFKRSIMPFMVGISGRLLKLEGDVRGQLGDFGYLAS